MQNDKTTLRVVSFIRDRTLLIPTACIFVSKWWYVYLQDIYAHTSWSTITFCGTRGCEDPLETSTSHWGLSAPQSHSNLYLLALSHVFGLNSNMTSSESSSSLTTQTILVVFLHLFFSITSLSFISFISYSYHHYLQFSCLFIHLKIIFLPPLNHPKWNSMREGPCLVNRTERRIFPTPKQDSLNLRPFIF